MALRLTNTGYEIEVEVGLKLSIFNGRRIRIKFETVHLVLSGKRESLEKSTAAIREYKCPNGANSISLLEDGVPYSGEQVITEYNIAEYVGE